MRKGLWLIGMLVALTLAACAAQTPAPMQGTADDEAALRGMAAKYTASFNANDAAALAQMVTEDFENIGADGAHPRGRAAFQQMEETGIQERQKAGLKLTLNATTGYLNWINATNAVVGGTYTMGGLPAGAPDKGSWIVVCEKGADGTWRMANSLVAEYMPPPPPPPPPAPAAKKGK